MYTNNKHENNSLENRLSLDDSLGTWLDYWLFLHGDETHSVWSSRPIGIKTIADAALCCKKEDQVLFQQLQLEISSWLKQNEGLKTIESPPPSKEAKSCEVWPYDWDEWFKKIKEISLENLDSQILVTSDRVSKRIGIKEIADASLLCEYREKNLFDQLQLEVTSWLQDNEKLAMMLNPPDISETVTNKDLLEKLQLEAKLWILENESEDLATIINKYEPGISQNIDDSKYEKYAKRRKCKEINIWSNNWESWLKRIQKIEHQKINYEIAEKIARSVSRKDFAKVFKWTRSLASELGSMNLSRRYLFRVAKNMLCDSGLYKDKKLSQKEFHEAIASVLLCPKEFNYKVLIRTEALELTTQQLKIIERYIANIGTKIQLFELGKSSDIHKQYVFKGLQLVVQASHSQLAFEKALDVVELISEKITTEFGEVELKLLEHKDRGDVIVTNQDTGERETKLLPLPKILWGNSTGSKRRRLEVQPKGFSKYKEILRKSDVKKWEDIMKISSRVKRNWHACSYLSSAEIWKMLGKFSSEKIAVSDTVNRLFEYLPDDALEFLVTQITSQSENLKKTEKLQGNQSDWHFWNRDRQSMDEWIEEVLNESDSKSQAFLVFWWKWYCKMQNNQPLKPEAVDLWSISLICQLTARRDRYFINWGNPSYPMIVFNEEGVGLIQIMNRIKNRVAFEKEKADRKVSDQKIDDKGPDENDLKLMQSRLRSDLNLLQGAIRHKIFHDDEKVFCATTTRYLGRVGFEALFMIMNGDVRKYIKTASKPTF
jgi:hypothetical protein